MNKNRIIGFISTLLFTLLALFVAYKVTTDADNIQFRVMRMWFCYVLLFLGLQGLAIKFGHMSNIKLEHIVYGEVYQHTVWKENNLQMTYFIPFIQDFIIAKNYNSILKEVIYEYEESEYQTPKLYQVASTFLTLKLNILFSAVVLVGIFVLPKVTNDYDLYRGLTYEQVIMATIGLGMTFYTIVMAVVNKALFDALDETMEVPNTKFKSIVLSAVMVISIATLILIILAIITGVLNIQITAFKFLFNFELIGIYILLTPVLLLILTAIVKNQLGRYNIYLDQELKEVYY